MSVAPTQQTLHQLNALKQKTIEEIKQANKRAVTKMAGSKLNKDKDETSDGKKEKKRKRKSSSPSPAKTLVETENTSKPKPPIHEDQADSENDMDVESETSKDPLDSKSAASTLATILDELTIQRTNISALCTKADMEEIVSKQTKDISEKLTEMAKELDTAKDDLVTHGAEIVTLKDSLKRAHENISVLAKENEMLKKLNVRSIRLGNQNEQYSRRESIRIIGLPQERNEDIKEKVQEFVKSNLNIDVEPKDIVAAHRLPRRGASQFSTTPEPLICLLYTSPSPRD